MRKINNIMYNKFQTKRGVMIANFGVAIAIILFTLFLILTGCVSAKKYNNLKSDLEDTNGLIQSFTWANDQLRNDARQLKMRVSKFENALNKKRAISILVDSLIKKEVGSE